MKNLYFITLLLCTLCTAQTIPIENTSDGRYEPVFKYRGFLYCKHFASGSTVPDGLYKISFADKTKTQISVASDINPIVHFTSIHYNPQFYNEDIFLQGYGNILELDSNDNTLVKVEGLTSNFCHVHEDYLLTDGGGMETKIKNLIGGEISEFQNVRINFPAVQIGTYMYYNYSVRLPNNEFSAFKYIGRSDENGNGFIADQMYESPDNVYEYLGFSSAGKPLFINNRLIYKYNDPTDGYKYKFFSIDIGNNSNNPNLLNNVYHWQNQNIFYLTTNDGVIFFDYITKKFYKTNAIYDAVEKTDMPVSSSDYFHLSGLFKTYDESNNFNINTLGNSFITIGNITYFRTTDNYLLEDKVWKINGIDDTPQLIASYNWSYVSSPLYATNWQNNLIFYNPQDKKIYRYTGTELIEDPELNARGINGKSISDYTITALIVDGDRLLINTSDAGMFIIDKTLATTEAQPSKLSIYPNPVKNNLILTEELKNIIISDFSGRIVLQKNNPTKEIELRHLPKGNYILSGQTKTGKNFSQKFIKE